MSTLIISGNFSEITPETIDKLNASYQTDLKLHPEAGIITGDFDISTMPVYRGEGRFNLDGSTLRCRDRGDRRDRYGRDRDYYDRRDDRDDRGPARVQSQFTSLDISDVFNDIKTLLPAATAIVIIIDGYKNLLNAGEFEDVCALWGKYIDVVTKEMREATFRSSVKFK